MLPKDPVMLLGVINMKLRDHYASLKDLCDDLQVDMVELCKKLDTIDYHYSIEQNQFI